MPLLPSPPVPLAVTTSSLRLVAASPASPAQTASPAVFTAPTLPITPATPAAPQPRSLLSPRQRSRLLTPLLMGIFLGLSIIPSLLRLPTIAIITTAQVTNGVLLPCVASLLLLSLNHAGVMGAAGPQPILLNVLMAP